MGVAELSYILNPTAWILVALNGLWDTAGIGSNAFKIGKQLQLGDQWSRSDRQGTQTVNLLGVCLPFGVRDEVEAAYTTRTSRP